MKIEPAGRTALVTGGGTGIGRAIAVALSKAGARVAVTGRRPDPLERVVGELDAAGGEAVAFPCDVTREDDVGRLVKHVRATLGDPEIVVHAAGRAWSGKCDTMTDADLDGVLAINLRAAFLLARATVPAMKAAKWGRIVHVASVAALRGFRYNTLYVASKHAVAGLTRSLAAELLPDGIRVNALAPGFADTDMVADAAATIMKATGRSREEAVAILAAYNPLGRLVTAEEVADAVLWLVGEGGAAVSGACIPIDGGTQPR